MRNLFSITHKKKLISIIKTSCIPIWKFLQRWLSTNRKWNDILDEEIKSWQCLSTVFQLGWQSSQKMIKNVNSEIKCVCAVLSQSPMRKKYFLPIWWGGRRGRRRRWILTIVRKDVGKDRVVFFGDHYYYLLLEVFVHCYPVNLYM